MVKKLGNLPIRFVIMSRRLLFLQYILQEQGDTLLHSFLVAQMKDTLKGDWWETVQNDLVELKLDLSLSEIKLMSVESFKKKVRKHVSEMAFYWLLNEKQRSKKIRSNEYSALTTQNYLKSEILDVKQKKFLTHLRGKMVKVKANYSKMYDNIFCPLCLSRGENIEDSQDHLIECKILSNEKDIDTGTEYMNIYSEEPRKFEEITVLLEQKFKQREKLIKTNVGKTM